MILCRECGNSAPSRDGFCSSCGALLDWSGEHLETGVLPILPPGGPVAAGGPGGPGAANPGAAWSPEPLPVRAAGPDAQSGRPHQGPAVWSPAAAPPQPPPHAPAPVARIPMPEARREAPQPRTEEPGHTGPFCQDCGVRNPSGRRFCRSCGALLRLPADQDERRRGWWRRLIDRLRGRRGTYAAGERPKGFLDHSTGEAAAGATRRGRFHPGRHLKLGRLAPLLIVAGLAGVGLGPARAWATHEINTLIGAAKSRINEHYTGVTPVSASGKGESGHAAALAIDGLNTTYWASGEHPDGAGDSITVTFASAVDIAQIGLLSGADPARFRAFARPRDLLVSATSAAAVTPVVLAFDDTADFQSRPLALRQVTSVTITVQDSYPGQQGHDLAIRELQFFTKSSV